MWRKLSDSKVLDVDSKWNSVYFRIMSRCQGKLGIFYPHVGEDKSITLKDLSV